MELFLNIVAWITIGFFFIRFGVVLFNLITNPFLQTADNQFIDKHISVLIPARNEAQNIGHLLSDLTKNTACVKEIIVYNDNSTDATAQIVDEFVVRVCEVSQIQGVELPKGWLGKNHACYQLAQHATGKYLLFLDADVRVGEKIFPLAVNYLRQHRLKLLSIFPKQIEQTFAERVTVSHMYQILTNLLPLKMVQWSNNAAFSAANGQFMLFDAAYYNKHQWHKKMKSTPVEDIAISKSMKQLRDKTATLLSRNEISCRMYTNYNEAILGFSKNVLHFFGQSKFVALFYWFFTTLGWLFVVWSLSMYWTAVVALLFVLFSALSSILNSQPIFYQLVIKPVQAFTLSVILWKALFQQKNILWKGRKIQVKY